MTDLPIRTAAVALLMASFASPASDEAVEPKQPDAPETTESRETPPALTRRAAPASTFTPSEQIKADSSVPFPVDI